MAAAVAEGAGPVEAEVEGAPAADPPAKLDFDDAAERAGLDVTAGGGRGERREDEAAEALRAGEGFEGAGALAGLAFDVDGSAERPRARSAHERVAMAYGSFSRPFAEVETW